MAITYREYELYSNIACPIQLKKLQKILQNFFITKKSTNTLHTNRNTFLAKHTTYQKAEPLRCASLSKLDNAVNNNSISNSKCPEFSTKWYVLFHFHNRTCAYNHPYKLHQKPITPLQLFLYTCSDLTCS